MPLWPRPTNIINAMLWGYLCAVVLGNMIALNLHQKKFLKGTSFIQIIHEREENGFNKFYGMLRKWELICFVRSAVPLGNTNSN